MTRFAIHILLVSVLAGCTSNASSLPGSSSATPPGASGFPRVYEEGGLIHVSGEDGFHDALTRGFTPKLSPDGTIIAFLRDPNDPHFDGQGDPFVLQAWLIYPDGSGLRKLGQQHGCCLGWSSDLHWSPDGSSVVLTGGPHEQELDVG